jgi:hypothetical protein
VKTSQYPNGERGGKNMWIGSEAGEHWCLSQMGESQYIYGVILLGYYQEKLNSTTKP